MANNIIYIKEQDLTDRQKASEQDMLREFADGIYTPGTPLVKLNPYIISPLSAVILFRTETETAVTITVRGKTPSGDITHTFPPGTVHILPVLGLYPDYQNTVDIRLYQGAKSTVTIKTEPLAESVPKLIHMKTTARHLRDNLIIVSPAVGGAATGFDYNGDVRFYLSVPMQMDLKRLKNGHLLIGSHRILHFPYYSSGLFELDMCGKIYKEYLIPGGYHHDQFEMPSGDILVLTEDPARQTLEDVLVMLDRETGEIKKTWDFQDFLTPGEGQSGKFTQEDWFHNNAVWYDEKTHSITLSGRHIDAMVNIDFDTGALNWIIGDPETWPEDKQKFFFRPISENFGWQYAQHACVVTPDGDVMCFDNGTCRSKNADNYVKNADNYSRGVRYRINTADMTIEQVWEFGRELGADFFSQHISNVEYLCERHYLIHSGGRQYYDGVPSEDLLTSGDDPRARREGTTYEVIDGEIALELKIEGNYYRAEKLGLYHDGANLEICDGRKLGQFTVTARSAVPETQDADGDIPEDCLAHIIEDSDRVILKARFELGREVFLLLEQDGAAIAYRVDTSGGRYAGICCLPQIAPDDRNTSTPVNKNGLSGEYDVYIAIDGRKHGTGVKISSLSTGA